MNKEQFLTELDASLKRITTEERQDILQDFEEHFAVGLEEGKPRKKLPLVLVHHTKLQKKC